MFRPASLLGGAGVGASLMYLLDPDRGRRRRSITRDRAKRMARRSGEMLSKAARDLSNRARGRATVVRTSWSGEHVGDDVLVARVRAAVERERAERLAIGGGVAANSELRARAGALAAELGLQVWIPPLELCTDNAAMIAAVARFARPLAYPDYLSLDASARVAQ
jgi:tRNA A37 threonylcarbamoyltransferase TsaD